MRVAIEGCMHGELSKMYETIKDIETREGYSIDLLLCCGDFQATRNISDLKCMAVPDKYKEMGSFYQYYSGEKIAPVLTIFIGGNHEASNYLQELPYGGWVAQNIYYLGYAGVVEFNGLRIAGMSGIYKGIDYLKGHFECPPYDESSKRSVYHIRNIDIFRLKQLSTKPDIILSHDWPRGIHDYGDVEDLLRKKKFFREDIENNRLGSRPTMEVLETLQPDYWFSAHLHVKFAAVMEHSSGNMTKFLALDKCLPNRKFLQVITINDSKESNSKLRHDPEWLAILRSTNHLLSVDRFDQHMPGPRYNGRWDFKPTADEIDEVVQIFGGKLEIPEKFVATAEPFNPATQSKKNLWTTPDPKPKTNPQTEWLCQKLDLHDPLDLITGARNKSSDRNRASSDYIDSSYNATINSQEVTAVSFNQDEIALDDDDDDDDEKVADPNSDEGKSSQSTPLSVATHLEVKRSSLSLPSPKRSLEGDNETEKNGKVLVLDAADQACFTIDKSGGTTDPEPTSSAKKTLKRRNQAMYATEDE